MKKAVTKTLSSVNSFVDGMKQRMLGADIPAEIQTPMMHLVIEQANARRANLRASMQTLVARDEEMARNIERFKLERSKIYEAPADFPSIEDSVEAASDIPAISEDAGFDDWRNRD